jgi:hypothetical protein
MAEEQPPDLRDLLPGLRKTVFMLTGSREMADQIVEEVLGAFPTECAACLEDGLDLETCLYRTAIRAVRRRQGPPLDPAAAPIDPSGGPRSPGPVSTAVRPGQKVLNTLARLAQDQREVLVLHDKERSDLAKVLQLSEEQAEATLRQAQERFRELFGEAP